MSGPRRIGSIINQLMASRGYAQVAAASVLQESVEHALGAPLAGSIRIGKITRGIVQIYASDSSAMQELTFRKRKLLQQLRSDHPAAKIKDVRFRVG